MLTALLYVTMSGCDILCRISPSTEDAHTQGCLPEYELIATL